MVVRERLRHSLSSSPGGVSGVVEVLEGPLPAHLQTRSAPQFRIEITPIGPAPSARGSDARSRVRLCPRSGVERRERRGGARGVDPDASVDDERALGRGDDRVEVELCDGGMRGHERTDAHDEVAQ